MRRALVAATLIVAAPATTAAPSWQFSARVAVTSQAGDKVYHHLDAAGRRSVAVSARRVAVVWEDNSGGKPTAYIAIKPERAAAFLAPVALSGAAAAYAPSIASLGGGEFMVGWEEGGATWARVVTSTFLGAPARLDGGESAQVSFAAGSEGRIAAAWARREPHGKRRVYSAWIARNGDRLQPEAPTPVDRTDTREPQHYPVVAVSGNAATVLWEDRRRGHTTILAARRAVGAEFGAPVLVNEPVKKSDRYGSGSGVSRPTATTFGGKLLAAWMDKRGSRKGYGVYAAESSSAGSDWGRNERIQDDFGEQNSQWHPAIVANTAGQVVALWDDDRDGTSDVFMSTRTLEGWSGNDPVAPAASRAIETNPAAALDDTGTLHVVWMSQEVENGPTRLWYASGSFKR